MIWCEIVWMKRLKIEIWWEVKTRQHFRKYKDYRWSGESDREGKVDTIISYKDDESDSWKPMEVILAIYAYYNDFSEEAVWKWTKCYCKNAKKMKWMRRNLGASMCSSRGIKYQIVMRLLRTAVLLERTKHNKYDRFFGILISLSIETSIPA